MHANGCAAHLLALWIGILPIGVSANLDADPLPPATPAPPAFPPSPSQPPSSPPPQPPLRCSSIEPAAEPGDFVGAPWQEPQCFLDVHGVEHCAVLPEGQSICDPSILRRLKRRWGAQLAIEPTAPDPSEPPSKPPSAPPTPPLQPPPPEAPNSSAFESRF